MVGLRNGPVRMTRRVAFLGAVLTSAAFLLQQASAQPTSEQLGTVRFETSGTAEAQKLFDQAQTFLAKNP